LGGNARDLDAVDQYPHLEFDVAQVVVIMTPQVLAQLGWVPRVDRDAKGGTGGKAGDPAVHDREMLDALMGELWVIVVDGTASHLELLDGDLGVCREQENVPVEIAHRCDGGLRSLHRLGCKAVAAGVRYGGGILWTSWSD